MKMKKRQLPIARSPPYEDDDDDQSFAVSSSTGSDGESVVIGKGGIWLSQRKNKKKLPSPRSPG
jgi:hypothetical protein